MPKTFDENYYRKKINAIQTGKKEGDSSDYLNFNLEGMKQPSIDVTNIQEVVDRCSLYFQRCSEAGLKPGVASMCVWLGISRQRWQKWCDGSEFQHSHQKACNKINGMFDAMMESYMQNGKINPVSGIFLMKNNFGYENDTPKKVEKKQTAIEERSISDILKLAQSNK